MKEALEIIKQELEKSNEIVRSNFVKMLERYSIPNFSQLAEGEQRTNRIHIHQSSIIDYDCGYVCYHVEGYQFDQLLEDYYDDNDIFTGWEQISEKIEHLEPIFLEDEDDFYDQLNEMYMEWFVKLWSQAKSTVKYNTSIQYCWTENSMECFDLNLLNWDTLIDNNNYSKYTQLIQRLDETPIDLRKRIAAELLDDKLPEINRVLIKDAHQVSFNYDHQQLKATDNQGIISYATNFDTSEEGYIHKFEAIKYMLSKIEVLTQQGYVEE